MRHIKRKRSPCLCQIKVRMKKFESVSMEALTFHSRKSVILTRLESSTSQKRTQIAYMVDTGSDGNFMSLRVFRIPLSISTMAEQNATIKRSIMLKNIISQT